MLKFEKVEIVEERVVDIICNVCGKSCRDKCDMNYEYADLSANWGYGSNKDMLQTHAHICSSCYDKIAETFVISAVINERNEEDTNV